MRGDRAIDRAVEDLCWACEQVKLEGFVKVYSDTVIITNLCYGTFTSERLSMQVKLRVLRGSSAGKEIGLKGPKFLIGRAEDCQMRARSDAISRRHCAVFLRRSGVVVRDLGSRNGTFVNGSRIDGDHVLEDGDLLQVGPLEFAVIVQLPAEAKASINAAKSNPEGVGDLVNQWLEELDDAPVEPDDPHAVADAEASDTGRFYTDDTEQVSVDPTGEISENATDDTKIIATDPNKEVAKDEETADGKKKKPGKLPKMTDRPDAPKNTQEAAAQMLRKMWNRR